MIIYNEDIQTFTTDCDSGEISNIVDAKVKMHYGGHKDSETRAWASSLPFVSKVLKIGKVPYDVYVAVEYNFEINNSRVDVLVYGLDEKNRESVVIIELKQWSEVNSSNKRNYVVTFGGHGRDDYQHPSYQSLRYMSILKDFNEYVQTHDVQVNACSFLHNMDSGYTILSNLSKYPYVKEVPVYYKDQEEQLAEFIKKFIKKGKQQTLYDIDDSTIHPSKHFSELFNSALKGKEIFSLDDDQSEAVSTIISEVKWALENNQRRTIIVKGGPGTGKSVVAINAMGMLLHPSDGTRGYNVCYTTATFTPRKLFSEILVDDDPSFVPIENLFVPFHSFNKYGELKFDCVFIDEAHRSVKWKFTDYYRRHISKDTDEIERCMNASRVNVWFIDEDQMVTKDDYLTTNCLKKYANEKRSVIISNDNLRLTTQFRCLGGDRYVRFVRNILGYNEKRITVKPRGYEFGIVRSPSELWGIIRGKQEKYPHSRLVAGYTHEWRSKKNENEYDFEMEDGKFNMRWNLRTPHCTFVNDPMQMDRIGSIYTVQGVDLDYAGVIIGEDLTFRDGKIVFDKTKIAKTDRDSGIRTADDDLAARLIRNVYMVLLTRARFGTYVYCEDYALGEHIKEKWDSLLSPPERHR